MLLFLQFIRTLHRWISYITKPIGFYFWHIHSQEWTMSRIVGADKTVVLKQLEKPHANVRCKWWLCPSARQYVSRGCLLHFDSYYLYYVSVKRDRLTVYIYILWPHTQTVVISLITRTKCASNTSKKHDDGKTCRSVFEEWSRN